MKTFTHMDAIGAAAVAREAYPAARPEYEQAAMVVANRAAAGVSTRAVLVSSAWSGEGTTTAVIEMARALRDRRARVLVIELNFQRPTMIQKFRLEPGRTLASWDTGTWTVADAPAPEGFSIMPAPDRESTIPFDVAALLQRIIAQAESRFDVVLVDTPPLLENADGLAAAAAVSQMILVVEPERTRYRALERIRNRLSTAGVLLLGTIVNKQPRVLPAWLERRLR